MSLIGGYFRKTGKMEDAFIAEKAKSFSIIPDVSGRNYETIVYGNLFGHIIAKYNFDAPVQVKYMQTEDYAVITLGFHNLSYVEKEKKSDWKLSVSELVKQVIESEGEFVSIVMDRRSGDIDIINDRFSSRPFYILQDDDCFIFSSNIAFLLHLYGKRLEADPLGWLQIFSYGHTLDTRTNLQNVERLRPASHIRITTNGITEEQYWFLKHEPRDDLDPLTFAHKVFEAFEKSVAKRAALFKKGFVSLSGGLDSRLVAGAMPSEADFYLMTFGPSGGGLKSPDIKVARQIGRIFGREHCIRSIQVEEVCDIAETVVRLTGGLIPIHHPVKSFQALPEMQKG